MLNSKKLLAGLGAVAGLGIAMCNGRDIVKESADVVTEKDNNNDGLVPYLI